MLDELEELDSIRAYDTAKQSIDRLHCPPTVLVGNKKFTLTY